MIDVIICVKNPPEILYLCLQALDKQKDINKIIIVLPKYDFIYYENYLEIFFVKDIFIVHEPKKSCLAYARKLGITKAESEYIAFIDADVILGKNHLSELVTYHKQVDKPYTVIEGILNIRYTKKSLTLASSKYNPKKLQRNERGFTHNTLMLRKELLNWNPPFTFAFEDYCLTRYIHNNKGDWYRYNQKSHSIHIKEYNLFKRTKWGTAGKRIVLNPSNLCIWKMCTKFVYVAIKKTVLLKDIHYFVHNIVLLAGTLIGHYKYQKYMEL